MYVSTVNVNEGKIWFAVKPNILKDYTHDKIVVNTLWAPSSFPVPPIYMYVSDLKMSTEICLHGSHPSTHKLQLNIPFCSSKLWYHMVQHAGANLQFTCIENSTVSWYPFGWQHGHFMEHQQMICVDFCLNFCDTN